MLRKLAWFGSWFLILALAVGLSINLYSGVREVTGNDQPVVTVTDCHGPGDCGYSDNGLNGDH